MLLEKWEIREFLEHAARMVHLGRGVNVDQGENKVLQGHRDLWEEKAKMEYLVLTDYRETVEVLEPWDNPGPREDRDYLECLVCLDILVERGRLGQKAAQVCLEILEKTAPPVMTVHLALSEIQVYKDPRAKMERQELPESEESGGIQEIVEHQDLTEHPVFLELWDQLAEKARLAAKATLEKREVREMSVISAPRERQEIWELLDLVERKAHLEFRDLLVTEDLQAHLACLEPRALRDHLDLLDSRVSLVFQGLRDPVE